MTKKFIEYICVRVCKFLEHEVHFLFHVGYPSLKLILYITSLELW